MSSDDQIPIPASASSGPRHIPDEGLQHALCVNVIHMGDVLEDFPGSEPKVVAKARIFFELQEVLPADAGEYAGKPYMLSTSGITLSSHEKGNLSKLLKGWLGKECPEKIAGFPLKSLIGRHATLNVIHKEKKDGTMAARIEKILPAQKGAAKLAPVATAAPAWVAREKEENAKKVEQFRRAQDSRAADHAGGGFDSVPF
jgi:hypothetical protein